jgi:hypothetical protein
MFRPSAPFLLGISALLLVGCASDGSKNSAPRSEKIGAVISQPVRDLNLQRTRIPAELQTAAQTPYPDVPADCSAIEAEIAPLDKLLGPDVGSPQRKTAERIDPWAIAQDAAGGVVPFRGIVRRLSGASAADEAYRDAVLAGFVKRAYLKGILSRLTCTPSTAL